MSKVVIGTRGSRLARLQVSFTASLLREQFPSLTIDERVIVTEGDKRGARTLAKSGDKGLFTRAIERELLDKTIDMAVHSYKDLPTELPHGLRIGAVLKRGPVEDVLIGPPGSSIEGLPAGARVGAGGIRRAAQLRRLRPDLVAADIEGNVDTRLKKLDNGNFDAIILAHAGIMRMELGARIACILGAPAWYHAVGQGALAVEIREEDAAVAAIVGSLDHAPTRMQTDAERSFLKGLGGGCLVPVGVRGSITGDRLDLGGMVCGYDGSPFLEAEITGIAADANKIGSLLAKKLLKKGAGDVLASVRERERENVK
jgi:hydroxymethylbilane synthase